jgi:ABC-2 type transport system ATP-binding protein
MEKGRILVSGTLEEIRTALHSQNRLHIQILPPVESALTLLETWPGISGLQPEEIGGLYSARFSGDKDAAAALLVALHEAGARVSEFWCERDDVESLFLQIGGKEVS